MASPTANFLDLRHAAVIGASSDIPSPMLRDEVLPMPNKKVNVTSAVKFNPLRMFYRFVIVSFVWMVGAYFMSWWLRGVPPTDPWSASHSTLRHVDSGLKEFRQTKLRVGRGIPKLYDWSEHTEDQLKVYKDKTMMLVFYDKMHPETSAILEDLSKVAEANSDTPLIHVSVELSHIAPFEFFLHDHPENDVPFVVITEPNNGFKKYRMDVREKVNYESLMKFSSTFLQHKLKPWLRSEPPVPEDKTLAVRQLTGDEFNKAVIADNDHDVMVFFYAPWCGHCRRFSQFYEELGSYVKNVKSLKLYKVDATKNDVDHPEVAIERVPYVRLFKAGQKHQPVVFRHMETDLMSYAKTFLDENVAIPFDVEEANKNAIIAKTDAANEF
eukprot:GDKJ01047048.1.p1 GENE.GDKJ01047048.1~~GDKJ01047048.1.p1  ORF type:complete len:383 (-),score=69.62 GDKJ01047048.1:718-1866(-)